MWSHDWGRFCKVMFVITLIHVLCVHLILKPNLVDRDSIAYFMAIIMGLSGSIFVFISIFPKHRISHEAHGKLLWSLAGIVFLCLLEACLNLRVQILFNSQELRGSITHMIFKWVVVSSTILQIYFMRRGGLDGLQRIVNDFNDSTINSSLRVYFSKDTTRSNEKLQQRDL